MEWIENFSESRHGREHAVALVFVLHTSPGMQEQINCFVREIWPRFVASAHLSQELQQYQAGDIEGSLVTTAAPEAAMAAICRRAYSVDYVQHSGMYDVIYSTMDMYFLE